MANTIQGWQSGFYLLGAARQVWGAGGIEASGTVPTGMSPTYMGNLRDVTTDSKATKLDVSVRGSRFHRSAGGQILADFTGEILWLPGDPNFVTLRSAYHNGNAVPALILDQLIAVIGAQGYYADWAVLDFTREEKLDGTLMAKIALSIGTDANSAVPPQYVTVTT